jgi:hypothetical protein
MQNIFQNVFLCNNSAKAAVNIVIDPKDLPKTLTKYIQGYSTKKVGSQSCKKSDKRTLLI